MVIKRRRKLLARNWSSSEVVKSFLTGKLSFRWMILRQGPFTHAPIGMLETRSRRECFAPTSFWEEAVFGLAVRADRLERQSRRDALRIAQLERELSAVRAGASVRRADAGARVGPAGEVVPQPLGDGWSSQFERDQWFVAVAQRDDDDAVEDQRRA